MCIVIDAIWLFGYVALKFRLFSVGGGQPTFNWCKSIIQVCYRNDSCSDLCSVTNRTSGLTSASAANTVQSKPKSETKIK